MDIENEKWIEPSFAILTTFTHLEYVEGMMDKISKALGWKVTKDKKGKLDEEGLRWYSYKAVPKNLKASPKEISEKRDIIIDITFQIDEALGLGIANEDEEGEKSMKSFIHFDEKLEKILVISGEIFKILAPLDKFIELEKYHKGICKRVFSKLPTKLRDEYINDVNSLRFAFGRNKKEKRVIGEILAAFKKYGMSLEK
jgi:hypothetical protein